MAENETLKSLLVIAAGVLFAAFAIWNLRYMLRIQGPRHTVSVIGVAVLSSVALALIAVGGVWYWYYHRPIPDEITKKPLFEGIIYTRDVRIQPRPLVVHVLTIDLNATGIEFFVTPGDAHADHHMAARKTSQFLDEFSLQAAINGSFFAPWWSEAPWDYYPHVGDPVHVLGLSSSQGNVYESDAALYPVLYISADNQVSINTPPGEVFNAIAGSAWLMGNGEVLINPSDSPYYLDLHPRTAVCTDPSGEDLIMVVVDGRQPNYSEGVSLLELAEILQDLGCYHALNLDGGGSSTMVIEGQSGAPHILNSPIDNRIPGRERPIANHLGVWAKPLGE